MQSKFIILLFFIGLCQLTIAQNKPVIIKASNKKVSIKDGYVYKKDIWIITPETKPDVYITKNKKLTFYTDKESITIKLNQKTETYNFIILLNGKDSAFTQIKYQLPYIVKLKKAKKYNFNDKRYIPRFTYQSQNDPKLVKIRQNLKLDSIAGTGNEISKILNLMHWVHYVVRHDGNGRNPVSKNALDLISVCRTEKRGVNCRMMATILNECYLSLGIKSRFITCMPKETEFDDCHVINMVYSNDLKKWIWIDPTFDAYVMNEKGELLSIEEVRERLINDKPLILNPDANWNREESQTKADYLGNYMAKNLYRLQCLLVSEYDSETWVKGKEITHVELLPLDGIVQTPQKNVESFPENKFIYYKTNNPILFWTKPE
jgi:hypothetical protein